MNLDELVRTALVEETRAEPDEGGAYDRFLQRRKRTVLRTAASTGLAVALVLALAIGTALIVRGGSGGRVAGPLAPAPTTARAPGRPRRRGRPRRPWPSPHRCPSRRTGWSAGSARGSS